jgi:hypothetical protein
MSTNTDLSVAQEIHRQIGPMAFMMMGASKFMGSENFLQFNIGSNPKRVTKVRVHLEPSDTYRVTFYGRGGAVLSESEDVYCDSLRDVLTAHTGLYTRLGG